MPIMFNTILAANGFTPSDVRLLRHQDTRSAKGRSPYELWRDDTPEFERYQSMQGENKRTALSAKYWASFVGTPSGSTLFVGMYSATYQGLLQHDTPKVQMPGTEKAGSLDVYALTRRDELSDLIGKLSIAWGAGARSWIQRADKREKPVVELRPEFKEPEFPGFLFFIKQLSELQKLPPSWQAVLSSSGGRLPPDLPEDQGTVRRIRHG